jgi:hypothetical protein
MNIDLVIVRSKAKLFAAGLMGTFFAPVASAQGALYCFYHGGTWYCLPWWWF